jgi:pilus assembly protein TadC
MIQDERIGTAKNHIASHGFGIWYVLLLAALLCRQFYRGQPLSEYWDIALIFFIGTFYVAIAGFAQGAVQETTITRLGKRIVPVILITIVAVAYFQGRVNSVADLVGTVLSALVGLSLMGLLFYYLYRRWERQNELDDFDH